MTDPTPESDREALAKGLRSTRDVLQLRRALPLEPALVGVGALPATRSLVPGSPYEAAWIRVNNRAFADHPDQSGFTVERLHAAFAEPWFDAAGFRLHERDGRLAAFCWTKVHPPTATEPQLGEIYVIGVDPDFQGLGLGRGLTLAGLDWLANSGVVDAMLYVDATNVAARALYDHLGFTWRHVDRLYEP